MQHKNPGNAGFYISKMCAPDLLFEIKVTFKEGIAFRHSENPVVYSTFHFMELNRFWFFSLHPCLDNATAALFSAICYLFSSPWSQLTANTCSPICSLSHPTFLFFKWLFHPVFNGSVHFQAMLSKIPWQACWKFRERNGGGWEGEAQTQPRKENENPQSGNTFIGANQVQLWAGLYGFQISASDKDLKQSKENEKATYKSWSVHG